MKREGRQRGNPVQFFSGLLRYARNDGKVHVYSNITAILLIFLSLPAFAACLSCHNTCPQAPARPQHCTGCHDGIDNTSREDLAHYKLIRGAYASHTWESAPVYAGAQMIKKYACRRCHSIDREGASLASNLDVSIRRLTPEEIVTAIKAPNDQMPDFRLSTMDIECLTTAVLRYSRINSGAGMVEVVHFGGGRDTDVFQSKCGGCHMILSKNGALGKRSLAPFLSGIDTEYYPPLDNRSWSRPLLSDWLDNPRKIKPFATMPVIPLKSEEKDALLGIIWE